MRFDGFHGGGEVAVGGQDVGRVEQVSFRQDDEIDREMDENPGRSDAGSSGTSRSKSDDAKKQSDIASVQRDLDPKKF